MRVASYTPNKKSISYKVFALSPLALANCAALLFIKVAPPCVGHTVQKHAKIFFFMNKLLSRVELQIRIYQLLSCRF